MKKKKAYKVLFSPFTYLQIEQCLKDLFSIRITTSSYIQSDNRGCLKNHFTLSSEFLILTNS